MKNIVLNKKISFYILRYLLTVFTTSFIFLSLLLFGFLLFIVGISFKIIFIVATIILLPLSVMAYLFQSRLEKNIVFKEAETDSNAILTSSEILIPLDYTNVAGKVIVSQLRKSFAWGQNSIYWCKNKKWLTNYYEDITTLSGFSYMQTDFILARFDQNTRFTNTFVNEYAAAEATGLENTNQILQETQVL